jgi:glycosyltransferase involved in cell wall biosynthesis
MRSRVLHLSLSHGGGIISALEGYIENSDFADHYLIAANDDSCQVTFKHTSNLKGVFQIKKNISGLREIRRIYSEIKPTHIHLHSSVAGVVGRILFPLFGNLIYTPHCFAFERTDVSFFTRKFFYIAEVILSIKPSIIAGCSPREVDLADRLVLRLFNKEPKNIFLTNYSNLKAKWISSDKSKKRVIMIGRICPQKDPEFFLDTFKLVHEKDNSIEFCWIGGGDVANVDKLLANGILCTGWLDREQLQKEILASDLYFHCAGWEGNPMSILEVCKMEMPIVARDIPSVRSIGVKTLSETSSGCAELILKHFNGLSDARDFVQVNSLCNIDNQRNALKVIYSR